MNVRDYWISKLPEVRKQSSATGRLVESLLINDSKVARETLVEMTKINKSILKEEMMSKDERDTFIKNNFGSNDRLNKIVKNVYNYENKDTNKMSKKELQTLKQNYLNKQRNMIDKLRLAVEEQTDKIKDSVEKKEDPRIIASLENELQAQINSVNEKVNAIPLDIYEPRYIFYFKKIMKAFGELFEKAGTKLKNFRNYWKAVYKINRPSLLIMISISLYFAIVFGVLIYKENKSMGNTILITITTFLVEALIDVIFLAMYIEFLVGIYKLIAFIRSKFSSSSSSNNNDENNENSTT